MPFRFHYFNEKPEAKDMLRMIYVDKDIHFIKKN